MTLSAAPDAKGDRFVWWLALALGPLQIPGTHGLFMCEAMGLAALPWSMWALMNTRGGRTTFWAALAMSLVLLGHAVGDGQSVGKVAAATGLGLAALAAVALFLVVARQLGSQTALLAGTVSTAVAALLQAVPGVKADPWKFGIGAPLSFFALVLLTRKKASWSVAVLLMLTGLNIVLGARALGLAFFVAAAITATSRRRGPSRTSLPRLAILLMVVIAAGFGLNYGLVVGARSGALQPTLSQKIESQNQGTLGVLLSARPEAPFEFASIRQAPILGHGRDAPLPLDVATAGTGQLAALGHDISQEQAHYLFRSGNLPLHSAILDLWAEAGVAGLLFVLGWFFMAMRGLGRCLRRGGVEQVAMMTALLTWVYWNLAFSPFSGTSRVLSELSVATLVTGGSAVVARHSADAAAV